MRIRDDFIDLRPDLAQVTFQRLCVLKFAVRFGFFDEGLQKGFLLKQRLESMREFRVWVDDWDIDRCSWLG